MLTEEVLEWADNKNCLRLSKKETIERDILLAEKLVNDGFQVTMEGGIITCITFPE